MQILVVAWALLVGAAQEENQSTETYAVECYLSAPLELVEDTVTCLNRTLRVQNGSKAVITGTAECFGDPGCSEDHSESLLLAQRIFTYGGGGLIFSFWACASLAGAWRVPGSLSEPNPQTAKVFSLHGFSRQMLGLNLCFLFLLVSMMSISIPTPAQKTCDFDITWFVLTHLGTRLLLSFLLFILMTAGVTAAKVVSIMRDMPKANLFLPWQEAERFAASVLEGQPCWMDRAVQVPQRPESCWIWCNSKVDASLEMMRRGWRDSKGREYKLEIQIVPMDDFTMHAMKDPGGYFMIEIDGHRLSHGFDQTHYMHFTARKGHCGMDFFWSHFWPMYKSNLTLLGLFQAAREASEPLQVLHVEKSCRLLPAEELKALLCDALMPSPGESGCVPSDHAAVQRVYVWRRRALQAAQRLPSEKMLGGEGHEGDEASTDLLHGNSRREEDLDWAYQGDLQEEANAPYVDRWRTGSVSQQDWFRLIGKAEFWLAHAFLELNRREPGLGHPLQAACEVLTSGLSSGRLTESLPGCRAILGRARKVLEPELRRSILAVERSQLDRLSAACTPVHSSLRSSRRPQSLLTAEMKNCLMAHTSHALKLAVTMKEQQALGYALIEAYRLNGEVLTGPLAKLVTEAWYLFQRLVFERTIVHAGLSPSTLKDIYEQHSCFGTAGLRAAWAENVCSSAFLADVQAFFDVVGQRGHEINVLASDLEVVEIQYVEHALSMQTYLARREELKVCVHPKCSGQVGDAQTVGPLGPWTHSAIRRCQGVWADKQGNYVWLIAGEEVINAATLVAEILEPESAAILRADHGHMNFRALPWPHLPSRPECGDTDSEVSLMWLVHQYSHTSRTNVKQINGVFQDAELGVIFWNSGHRESAPARWERSPVLFGHWWLQGREALLFPLEVFLQGAALLDLMAQHHGRVAEQKANLEAEFVEMAGNGVPSNYGAVLYYNQTFYPIWEERHPLEPIGRFRSRHFTGTVDKSNRRMEISPLEDPGSDALVPPFLKKLFGFRRGITARLSPKPLDLNVNEIFLLQGTTAASAQCPRDDSARVQTQVLSCHAGSSAGSGIYLTDSAVKADQCSELHPNGLCAILICRVCLGRVINQSEGDRHGNSIRRGSEYQSVKLASDVNEYVIFDPSQVYVEYLVWYRRRYHNLSRHE